MKFLLGIEFSSEGLSITHKQEVPNVIIITPNDKMAAKKIPSRAKDLHNQLVADLHDHINAKVDQHDFEKLKHRLKLKLTPMDLKTCNNIIELTDKLQKRGHVQPGKYEEFVKLIECIDKNWVDIITEKGEEISEIIDKANEPQVSLPVEESESNYLYEPHYCYFIKREAT